jgi:hypothetical protein
VRFWSRWERHIHGKEIKTKSKKLFSKKNGGKNRKKPGLNLLGHVVRWIRAGRISILRLSSIRLPAMPSSEWKS